MSITEQYMKQTEVQAKTKIKVCLKYFSLKSIVKLLYCCSCYLSYLRYLSIRFFSSFYEICYLPLSSVIMVMICLEVQRSPFAHKYLKLSCPLAIISQIAQKLGKHRTNKSILQWLLTSSSQPAKQANRQPIDQQTLDRLRMLALQVPGTTQVIYVAVKGKAMPMPTPQKKRTTTKNVKELHTHDNKPKMEVIMASASKNRYLPYLSENVYKYEPSETPKQTIVMSKDLSNTVSSHYFPSLGSNKPKTIVQQPSENSKTQSE